ncbi:MAG: carboxypeptidase M32, partial [Kiloniellaceae bacterium]|nr:carboxypeptidase M32 [Kiloniellaceae bacterium]
MTAAQLFAAARRARPEIPEALGRGDFVPLMGWLAEHVHAQASSAGFETIVEQATGEPLNPEIFKAHLKARYLPEA